MGQSARTITRTRICHKKFPKIPGFQRFLTGIIFMSFLLTKGSVLDKTNGQIGNDHTESRSGHVHSNGQFLHLLMHGWALRCWGSNHHGQTAVGSTHCYLGYMKKSIQKGKVRGDVWWCVLDITWTTKIWNLGVVKEPQIKKKSVSTFRHEIWPIPIQVAA